MKKYIALLLLLIINKAFGEATIESNYPLQKNNFSKVINKDNLQRMIGIIRNIDYIKDVKVLGFKENKPILYIERYPIIRHVKIRGNNFYHAIDLIPIANIRPGTPVKTSIEQKEKLIKDFLEEFYKNNGFLKAKVKDTITKTKDGYLNVYVNIKEGDLYFIRGVFVNGKKFDDASLPIGDIANINNLNKIYNIVRKHFGKDARVFVYQEGLKTIITKRPFKAIFGTQKIKHNIFHIVGVFINDISKFLNYPIPFTKAALGQGGIVDVYYKVYQRPLNKVYFEGNKAFNSKILKTVANISEIDIFTLEKAKENLLKFYKDMGYLDAKVHYKVNKEYTKATFYIHEGGRYSLKNIFSNSKALEGFIRKHYKDKYLNILAFKKLINIYHKKLEKEGYIYGFSYKYSIDKLPNYEANVHIDVNKGYKIILAKILIKGTKNKHILDIFKSYKTPREYKAKDIEDLYKDTILTAKKYGYFDVKAKPIAKVKILGKHYYEYIYTFYIDLGKRYENGNTVIYGYNHTLEHSIQYMAALPKYYSLEEERRAIKNLEESSIFEAVNIETFLNKKDKKVDRLIELQEGKRGFFRIKAGYNTEQRLVLDSALTWADLFGTPAMATFNYDISSLNTTYKLGIADKFLFSKDYLGDIFYQRDFEIHNSYYFVSKGINFDIGRRFGRYYTFTVGYSKTRDYVYNAPIQDNGYSNQETISFNLTRDYKNKPTNPTKLGYDNVTFTKSLQTGYNSFNINTYYLIHIIDKIFYSFKFGFGAENDGLIYQRFFLGGLKDMMGYNFEDIGSPEGGKYYGFLRNEIDFPVKSPFNLALFTDTGNVANNISGITKNLKQDVGVGVFVYTPIGPVRFDVAKPITKIPNINSSIKYYISIGYFY
ncbi:BamA/OMP85 family outer membrane protein [Hydrogenobaculum acidophilum]